MSLVPVFNGRVDEHGKLVLPAPVRGLMTRHLNTLRDKPVTVTIKPYQKRRSERQNAWHWAIAVPLIAAELGYDKHEHDRVHYALVEKCFGTTIDPRSGLDMPNVRSSRLTTSQFSELMEWEVRFAAEFLGILVPLPDEVNV